MPCLESAVPDLRDEISTKVSGEKEDHRNESGLSYRKLERSSIDW